MTPKLDDVLAKFLKENQFRTKGPLCVALVITQHARKMGLPLDPEKLVTTSPGEAVVERCRENLDDNLRPIIVTTERGLAAVEVLAENKGLAERIDVLEIEQFMASNLHELGNFKADGRRTAVEELIDRYNEVVDEYETDPSLKIEFKR